MGFEFSLRGQGVERFGVWGLGLRVQGFFFEVLWDFLSAEVGSQPSRGFRV